MKRTIFVVSCLFIMGCAEQHATAKPGEPVAVSGSGKAATAPNLARNFCSRNASEPSPISQIDFIAEYAGYAILEFRIEGITTKTRLNLESREEAVSLVNIIKNNTLEAGLVIDLQGYPREVDSYDQCTSNGYYISVDQLAIPLNFGTASPNNKVCKVENDGQQQTIGRAFTSGSTVWLETLGSKKYYLVNTKSSTEALNLINLLHHNRNSEKFVFMLQPDEKTVESDNYCEYRKYSFVIGSK